MWPSKPLLPEAPALESPELDLGETITSTANDLVKYVRSLHRREVREEQRTFFVEGLRTVDEALEAGYEPASIFFTESASRLKRADILLQQARSRSIAVRMVSESVMSAMSDTVTPSGLLAVLRMPQQAEMASYSFVLILDQLRDPGNMGTICRSALAAGVELLITTEHTVDVYSPKVIRAGMGAHFHLLMSLDQPWSAIGQITRGLRVLLADAGPEGQPYWMVNWQEPTALIIGGEAAGASPEAKAMALARVGIPMHRGVESLNASVAASVLLFEAARQRALRSTGP